MTLGPLGTTPSLATFAAARGPKQRAAHLSKSRFVAGTQCHKLLWWKVHEREAPELQPD